MRLPDRPPEKFTFLFQYGLSGTTRGRDLRKTKLCEADHQSFARSSIGLRVHRMRSGKIA